MIILTSPGLYIILFKGVTFGQVNYTKFRYCTQLGKQLVPIWLGKIGGMHDDSFVWLKVVYYSWSGYLYQIEMFHMVGLATSPDIAGLQ